MFKFDFSHLDLDLEEDENQPTGARLVQGIANEPKQSDDDLCSFTFGNTSNGGRVEETGGGKRSAVLVEDQEYSKAHEVHLDDLIQSLPPAFSYSPLVIPLSRETKPGSKSDPDDVLQSKDASESVTLLRRDLFDARYQLIADADTDEPSLESTQSGDAKGASPSDRKTKLKDALKFIDTPSDLVPGEYEGGLKTWECSLDLADYLAGLGRENDGHVDWVRGKRVFEIGCGTAIPTLYLLHTLFSRPRDIGLGTNHPWTEFVLQDYNDLVLRLVTFPNVLLSWYASPLADVYRSQYPSEDEEPFNPDRPGDLQITPDLLTAFRASLQEQHISIRFIAGSWQSLSTDDGLCDFPFDLTLTSETIYQMSSLPSLINILKRAVRGYILSTDAKDFVKKAQRLSLENAGRLCLVAAKVLYFGVGGGVMDFERAVIDAGGKTETVLERKTGVGRRVMNVEWAQSNDS